MSKNTVKRYSSIEINNLAFKEGYIYKLRKKKMKRSSKAIDLQEISIRKASPENSNNNVKDISTAQMHNPLEYQYINILYSWNEETLNNLHEHFSE